MTVAAVILSASAEGALADTLGQPRVRRLVDIAWSGGALPVVVLSPDADGAVPAALFGSEATYGAPPPQAGGPVAQMVKGAEMAMAEVTLPAASLTGKNAILGRGVILHEKPDDFSQPTGNAGGRIACGVIGVAQVKK